MVKNPKELEKLRDSIIKDRDPKKLTVYVSSGTCGRARGSEEVVQAIKDEVKKQKLTDKVNIKVTGCHGFCEIEPIVNIQPKGIFYKGIKPEDAKTVVAETLVKGNIVEDFLYSDPETGKKVKQEQDIPFYKKQKRIVFGDNALLDPESIEDYIATGGYRALATVLSKMKPEEVIKEVKDSGLRGRGGGGFLTGKKWQYCREAHGDTRYVICNADEGDPGAYMDRSLLEGNPHSGLEGMIFGAYAIGSPEGYIYVRNEYPLAVKNVMIAIDQAREYGFLGKRILGSGFDFDINICRGGGAFVCGESTALMASLEGKAGRPRAKYIHTIESGLWEKPSNLNNVETWSNVPLIINKGKDWYSKIGTEGSKGTKIFSLVGKIKNTGLVEVPMGITLREIIYDIGGGIPNGKKFKAVQTGGPSGGCIPEKFLDLPVDFDELYKVGSMMGSGGMIVMDEDTCMVDIARYFIEFLKEESCGKCVPCREGIRRMHEILADITEGKGRPGDVELLEEMSSAIIDSSLCALGSSAPNPVLSTIKYFRDEYIAHIDKKKCPAGACKALITYSVIKDECTGCGVCKSACPEKAISGEKKKVHKIDQKKCIRCGICKDVCKFNAVGVE